MPRKRSNAKALVPTGAPYGDRAGNEALAAQITHPVASAPAAGGAPQAPGGPPDVTQVALDHPAPTGIPLSAPSQNPSEPFTAGLPVGAGAGPNPLSQFRNDPLLPAAATLNQLGDSADPETAQLRALLNAVVGNSGAI